MNSPSQKQKIMHLLITLGQFVARFIMRQDRFEFCRDLRQLQHRSSRLLGAHDAPHLRQVHRENVECGELPGKSLGRSYSDLGPGMSVDRALSLARDHRAHHIADSQGLRSSGFGFALGRDRVRGLAGL